MEVTVNFKKSDLFYDVMNETHLVAREKSSKGASSKESYVTQATEESPDSDKLVMSLRNALASLQSGLSFFLRHIDIDSGNDEVIIVFEVSPRFNAGYVPVIKNLLYSYLVNTVLCEWFVIMDGQRSAAYATKANAAMGDLLNSFSKLPPRRP